MWFLPDDESLLSMKFAEMGSKKPDEAAIPYTKLELI